MVSRRLALCVLIGASLVAIAVAAHAANFDVSTKNRFFCCTTPAKFVYGAPAAMSGYHTVTATASVMGSGTPAIQIGMGHAARFYSMSTISELPGPTNWRLTETFSVSNAAGTLQKSGGNLGSFSFCPKAKGPGPGACTKASKATPASSFFNGRFKVTPGPHKFGGTLQILAGSGGVGGKKVLLYRLLPLDDRVQVIRGGYKAAPIGAATPGLTTIFPAPIMTGHNAPDYDDVASYPDRALWQNGAGRFTTGMLTVQVSRPFPFSVKLTGYDKRTPAGLGNIQVVSGLLSNSFDSPDSPAPGWHSLGWKMRIHVIPEPGPSLGLAAAALALLGVGALRAWRG